MLAGPASASEPNCGGASGPTSRAKPGTGLGSCGSRSVASRKLIKARAARSARPGQPCRRRCGRRTAGRWCTNRPVAVAALEDQRHLDADVRLGQAVERAELADGRLRRLVPGPVQPEHPLSVEGETPRSRRRSRAAASRPMPNAASTASSPASSSTTSSTGRCCRSAARAARARSSWVRVSSRAASGVELVGDRVHRSLGCIDVHVGQPRAAAAAGPARCGPTGSWRAARCRGRGSSSRAR